MVRKYRKKPRRTFRRRKNRPINTLALGRQLPGFPNQKVVKLRYVDIVTLNPGVASLAIHQFRGNSIFDPDLTGIGHQPLGRDEWANFYNHYVVTTSKITAQYMYDAGNSNSGYIYGCYLSDDATIPPGGLGICEQGLGNYGMAAGVTYAPVAGKSHAGSPTVSNRYNAKTFYNIKDIRDNTLRIGSQLGTNPPDTAIFTVWAQPVNATTDLGNIQVLVTLEYTVIFSEPKTLNQS